MTKTKNTTKEKKVDTRDGVEYCIHNIPKASCSWCTDEDEPIKEKED